MLLNGKATHGQHVGAVDDPARLVRLVHRRIASRCTGKIVVDTLHVPDRCTESTAADIPALQLADSRTEGVADSLVHTLGKPGDAGSILRNDRAVPVDRLA